MPDPHGVILAWIPVVAMLFAVWRTPRAVIVAYLVEMLALPAALRGRIRRQMLGLLRNSRSVRCATAAFTRRLEPLTGATCATLAAALRDEAQRPATLLGRDRHECLTQKETRT